ncbi:hypothetical protein HF669_11635 [Acidithiobacillus thiooxidans]|uniref:hypothetical protein n=1 Tax=Acidithiobacillus TaxID=119977 RepID=UPI0002624B18|nr:MULTISPECIES: hypothetical protein [Acidithiobacillus]MBU2740255.1 hypothetical protein [Acidithiobacillus albertensis]MBU2811996.1 hypothetical protein [Acidithiobacillus thiooxidans]MBU2834281.1 hypothetical protein [Acidithiobacillus thiooxidans]
MDQEKAEKLKKLEAQIAKLEAKKKLLLSDGFTESEKRRLFGQILSAENRFGLSYPQILGAILVLKNREMSETNKKELEDMGINRMKAFVQAQKEPQEKTEKPGTVVELSAASEA